MSSGTSSPGSRPSDIETSFVDHIWSEVPRLSPSGILPPEPTRNTDISGILGKLSGRLHVGC